MQKATRQQLKQQNRDLVLSIFFETDRISRAEISRITGLTRTTVSDIVADLVEAGLVEEVGVGVSVGGKSPILLSLVNSAHYMVSLDLAYNQFRGALVDLRGQIHEMVSLPVRDYTGEQAIEATFEILDQLVALPGRSLAGIGVAAPGLVNSQEGIVINAVNLGWQNLPLEKILSRRYKLPVSVLNDCQAAAMGEFTFGRNPTAGENMVVVRVGNGIGAGIILNGKIFQGDGGFAGEIGHVRVVEEGGLPCRCGKTGCLETVASARAVVQRARALESPGNHPPLAPTLAPVTLDTVVEAYQAGNPAVCQIIEQAARHLGAAISNLVSILNIHQIILMGEMTRAGQPWLDAVQQAMEQSTLARLGQNTQIRISTLGDTDVILGASALLTSDYTLLFN